MSCNEDPNEFDITIDQNASYDFSFNLFEDDNVTPINIVSWSFTGSIKEQYSDPTPILYFSSSVRDVISGSVDISLTAANTWGLGLSGSRFVYDLIANNPLTSPVTTYRLLQGKVRIDPGVTQP